MDGNGAFDQVFGIGFRVGFLIVLVGVIMFYFPLFTSTFELAIDYLQVLNALKAMPSHIKLVVAGFCLMGVAIVMSVFKNNMEDFVNLLFYNDKD